MLRQPFFFGLGNVIGPLVAGEELRREFGPDIPGFPREPVGEGIETAEEPETSAHNRVHPLPLPGSEDAGLL